MKLYKTTLKYNNLTNLKCQLSEFFFGVCSCA